MQDCVDHSVRESVGIDHEFWHQGSEEGDDFESESLYISSTSVVARGVGEGDLRASNLSLE